MRLIDADALLKNLYERLRKDEVLYRIPPHLIDDAPTIDPESLRKKGEWENDKDDVYWHNHFIHKHCSVCGKEAIYDYAMGRYKLTHFCPNCGADMRGDNNA